MTILNLRLALFESHLSRALWRDRPSFEFMGWSQLFAFKDRTPLSILRIRFQYPILSEVTPFLGLVQCNLPSRFAWRKMRDMVKLNERKIR